MTTYDKKLALELFCMLFQPARPPQEEATTPAPEAPLLKDQSLDFIVSKPYLVWTVTHHFTGEFRGFNGHELAFKNAAWIPDDGRAMDAFSLGNFSEIEPCPDGVNILIGRGSIIMAIPVSYPLPRSQK